MCSACDLLCTRGADSSTELLPFEGQWQLLLCRRAAVCLLLGWGCLDATEKNWAGVVSWGWPGAAWTWHFRLWSTEVHSACWAMLMESHIVISCILQ